MLLSSHIEVFTRYPSLKNQLFLEKLVFKEDGTGTYFPTSSSMNSILSAKLRVIWNRIFFSLQVLLVLGSQF